MASAQKQSANVDLFDAYFRRGDLDPDGRISGNEAVAFFQGSGLPKLVLAQRFYSRCGIYPIRITIACFLSESFVLPIFAGAFRDALFQQCYQTMLCLIYPIFFNLQIITPMLQCSLETCIWLLTTATDPWSWCLAHGNPSWRKATEASCSFSC